MLRTKHNLYLSSQTFDILQSSVNTKPKHKTFRDVFIRFAESTSVQGIPFINRGGHWYTKAIWAFLFFAALAAWLYHSYALIYSYYSYSVTTLVGITHDTLPFPSVTVCNINSLRKSTTNENGPEDFVTYLKDLEPKIAFNGQPPKQGTQPPPGPQGPSSPQGPQGTQGPQVGQSGATTQASSVDGLTQAPPKGDLPLPLKNKRRKVIIDMQNTDDL